MKGRFPPRNGNLRRYNLEAKRRGCRKPFSSWHHSVISKDGRPRNTECSSRFFDERPGPAHHGVDVRVGALLVMVEQAEALDIRFNARRTASVKSEWPHGRCDTGEDMR